MSREIKFRGVNVETGKMIFGSLVNNLWTNSELTETPGKETCEIIKTENEYDCWEEMENVGNIVHVIPETVGQFTGLLDKNGKEIYEGDIISSAHGVNKKEVVFEKGCFMWFNQPLCYEEDVDKDDAFNLLPRDWAEVIGNIHENPELLK